MEVDNDVREKMIENIYGELQLLQKSVKTLVERMKKATSVEEIVSLKQEMLLRWLDSMPLGRSTCYFCIKTPVEDRCGDCEYGKIHGKCTDIHSDYRKIIIAYNTLWRLVEKSYVKENEWYE